MLFSSITDNNLSSAVNAFMPHCGCAVCVDFPKTVIFIVSFDFSIKYFISGIPFKTVSIFSIVPVLITATALSGTIPGILPECTDNILLLLN